MKHILAVVITVRREHGKDPQAYSEVVKVTYSQDWATYNAAQCDEKRTFFKLLADLCGSIPSPRCNAARADPGSRSPTSSTRWSPAPTPARPPAGS